MYKKRQTWFNWRCPHCEHKHRSCVYGQASVPNRYTFEWSCERCGKKSEIVWDLQVWGWYDKGPKGFSLKHNYCKKKKKKRISVEKKDEGTKKDRGYMSHKV